MPVRVERRDRVLTVIHSRPEARNAVDPAHAQALYEAFVAFDGDEVDKAVKAHLADLTLMGSFTAKDQPSAAIYASTKWLDRSHVSF